MLAAHLRRLGNPVRYATSPALANYLRIVGGAHGLSPHHPSVYRPNRDPSRAGLMQDAFGGDADALSILLDHMEDRQGRRRLSPMQMLNQPMRQNNRLFGLLNALHNQTLSTDFHGSPIDIEGLFNDDRLSQDDHTNRAIRASVLPMYAGYAAQDIPRDQPGRLGQLRGQLLDAGQGWNETHLQHIPRLLAMLHEAHQLGGGGPLRDNSDMQKAQGSAESLLQTGVRNVVHGGGVTF